MIKRLYILLLILALAGMIWSGKKYNPAITLRMCLENPQQYDGETLFIGTEITVRDVYEDGFSIHQMGHVVRVAGHPGGVKRGDFVQLVAIFRAPDHLELQKLYVAQKRRWKIGLSILPLVLVGIGLIYYYRVNRQTGLIEERGRCRIS